MTGGAGAELGGTDPEHYFYHYIKVKVSPDGVQYQVEKIGKPFSNIVSLFVHNLSEFSHSYLKAHRDYFFLLLDIAGLVIIQWQSLQEKK